MKQSLKAYLPKLNELRTFKAFIEQNTEAIKYIAHCNDGEKELLKNSVSEGDDVVILIGPEGDFSPEEVDFAKQYGYKEISLGTARLRTETAGIVACHIVNLANE
jgi:16S rRNA (uracil1498-N3)-methyltransferase